MLENLMEIAAQTMETFNPETDPVDVYENLPDGEYLCVLEDVKNKVNDKGTQWISFRYTVLKGAYENKCLFVNYFFTDKTVERSIKALKKVAYNFGYDLPITAFETLETLAETLNAMAGNQAIVTQTTNKSGYSNYKVEVC